MNIDEQPLGTWLRTGSLVFMLEETGRMTKKDGKFVAERRNKHTVRCENDKDAAAVRVALNNAPWVIEG